MPKLWKIVAGGAVGLSAVLVVLWALPAGRGDCGPACTTIQYIFAVSSLIERHRVATGCFPCESERWNLYVNRFPELLCEVAARAGGGVDRVLNLKASQYVYWDSGVGRFRPATEGEIRAPRCDGLYLLDGWGRPLVYRLVPAGDGGPGYRALVYSLGRNGMDETALGQPGDDIGNW